MDSYGKTYIQLRSAFLTVTRMEFEVFRDTLSSPEDL